MKSDKYKKSRKRCTANLSFSIVCLKFLSNRVVITLAARVEYILYKELSKDCSFIL